MQDLQINLHHQKERDIFRTLTIDRFLQPGPYQYTRGLASGLCVNLVTVLQGDVIMLDHSGYDLLVNIDSTALMESTSALTDILHFGRTTT